MPPLAGVPAVWAIIVCYNGGSLLRKCLESLLRSTTPVAVVVIDNGSTDGSIRLIQKEFPAIRLVLSPENLGFGRANNAGIQLALQGGAEHVFLLNQDAWVEPETLSHLIGLSRQHPDLGILSPVHLNADGSALDYGFANYLRADRCPGFISDLYVRHLQDYYILPFVNAAAWLLPRHSLEKVGGFNPVFFMYGEDMDLCHRVRFHGLRIGVVPRAVIYHARGRAAAPVAGAPMSKGERIKQEAVDMALLLNINQALARQLLTFAGQTVYSILSLPISRFAGFWAGKWNVVKKIPRLGGLRRVCKRSGGAFLR
jgi:GT2 family glycosyltransferase